MPLPEYKYGKVTGTFPDLRVVSERSESPMVCCGYCSTHMACATAKAGLSDLMKNEAHAIRKAGGRPHNAGSRASERRAGAKKALGVTLLGVAIEDIPDRLRKGFAVEVAVQYADLPAWLKVQKNDFGHTVLLFGWREAENRAGFFDPLWSQGARGAWAPWTSVKRALWANGNHNTTTLRRLSPPEEDDMEMHSAAGMLRKLPAGTDVYDEPNGKKVSDISEATATKTVFRVVATTPDKKWWLIDGGGNDGVMRWVKAI